MCTLSGGHTHYPTNTSRQQNRFKNLKCKAKPTLLADRVFSKHFLQDTSPFVEPLIPGLLVTSALGFKARVDPSCACLCARVQRIPQIHLWCNTCQPLDGQHGSRLHSLHTGIWRPPTHSKQTCYTLTEGNRKQESPPA